MLLRCLEALQNSIFNASTGVNVHIRVKEMFFTEALDSLNTIHLFKQKIQSYCYLFFPIQVAPSAYMIAQFALSLI